MSNTVITNLRDAGGGGGSADSPLVVVLERDGTISLDEHALRGLVGGDNSQSSAGISVVRVLQDGKPDDATDTESDDGTIPHVTLSVDGYYDDPNGIAKYDSGIEMLQSLSNETREHSLIGFHNDHCYTPLTSSSLPLPSHSSSQPSYGEPVIETAPKLIPSSKKITILEQQIIPKGKKIVINTTEAPVILKGSDVLTKPLPGLASKLRKPSITSSPQVEEKKQDEIYSPSEQTESSESSEESVNDRDSDSDYKYSREELSPVRSKKSKRDHKRAASKKTAQIKNVSKQISKSRPSKSLIQQEIKDKILHKKSKLLPEQSHDVKKQQETEPIPNELPKVEDKPEPPKPPKVIRKEKKTPAHVTALLSDMTTLFSTPDVIRRVSTDTKSTNKIEKSSIHVDIEPKQTLTPKTYSKQLKERITLTEKMVKEIESIPQIDEASLAQLLQDTPVISTSSETIASHGHVTTASVIANPLNSPNLLGAGLTGPLSPTLDLLAGLQPEEEGLTEDLLMHVARLVENDENLQEVIDKQVLGKVDPMVSKPRVTHHQNLTFAQAAAQRAAQAQRTSSGSNKNPIQVVRSDGRVITLPPIEAPATRSSKRKSQATPNQEPPSIPHEDPKSELTVTQGTPRQYSNKKVTSTRYDQPSSSGGNRLHPESDDSLNSEDDPYRLWCICKQPHNNRFMICCDKCEEWFHGKCVNITKAMGQQMEEQGVEWTCPKCKKNQTPKPLPKPGITRRSTEGSTKEAAKHKPEPSDSTNTSCVVCKRTSRTSSIYCSDACILKHAQESLGTQPSLTTTHKKPDLTSDKTPLSKPKGDSRVIVFERKTGRCLAGPNAPTADNLEAWLQDNPTFEVVRPGTLSSIKPMVNVKKTPPSKPPQKVQTTLKFDKQQKQIILMQPQSKPLLSDHKQANSSPQSPQDEKSKTALTPKQTTPQRPSLSLRQTQITPKQAQVPPKPQQATSKPSPVTPKQIQVIPAQKTPTEVKKTSSKNTPLRTQSSTEKPPTVKSPTTTTPRRKEKEPEPKKKQNSVEPIRENVRKALQEQMTLRFGEMKGQKFTEEEVKIFAVETEAELHGLFKDVGVKYKAKYRSLMFNIKDRKNLSLWQKICDKTLTPKQLVRLSPEELASQELAQWRDKEAKYQLELIKKSELDLLSATKTYVLKTHKGEEVMESQGSVPAELDPNVSVADLVTALNDSSAVEEEAHSSSPREDERDLYKNSKHKGGPLKKSPSRERAKRARSSSRHRGHKDDKSKAVNKKSTKDKDDKKIEDKKPHRERNRSRSRERMQDKTRAKSEKRQTRSKSTSRDIKESNARSRSRLRLRSRHRSRSKHRSESQERTQRSHSQENDYHSKDKYSSKDSDPIDRPKSSLQKEIHPEYDPHEPMITSAFSEEDLRKSREDDETFGNENMIDATVPYKESTDECDPARVFSVDSGLRLSTTSSLGKDKISSEAESDQEPSSTVDSSAAAVWSGCINMVDVARFYVAAHEVSGNGLELEEDLSAELDIVGRINPETVWEYISKMKRTGNKDIIVLRLSAANDEERMQYIALYSYLNSRNRLGVVKVSNSMTVKDFYIYPLSASSAIPPVLLPMDGPGLEDVRNHLLVAIIVRQRKKRLAPTPKDTIPAKISKSSIRTRSYTPPVASDSYTPPASPARRSGRLQLPLPYVTPTPALPTSVKDKIAASLASAEEEEAYSPGSSSGSSAADAGAAGTDALRSKMNEINRQIEEQKQQIMSMSATIQPDTTHGDDEAYSPSRPMTPPRPALADIALPSNLQEILANIQQRSAPASQAPPPPPPSDVDMRVPPPPPPPPTIGKLHALSEEELLRMVPDDAN